MKLQVVGVAVVAVVVKIDSNVITLQILQTLKSMRSQNDCRSVLRYIYATA